MTESSKQKTGRDVISGIFFSAAVAMILTALVGVIANMIDGIITSNFYGPEAYSAISLSGPIISTITLFAAFISTGSQMLCSQFLGRGDRESANRVFTLAIFCGLFISAFFVFVGFFFPDLLASVCGVDQTKHPEIYANMQQYFRGYLPGIPALVFVDILGPLVVLGNGKKLVAASAVALCVTDVIGDLLNALVFDGHNLGMGLATSVALWVELGIISTHFIRKHSCFRFTPHGLTGKNILEICKYGSPTFVRKLATILRDLFINRFNIIVSLSAAAIAARSIQNDINAFMFTLGPGIGKVLLTMVSLYYSAGDRRGLTRLFKYSMHFGLAASTMIGTILFVFAPGVVSIFTRDPDIMGLAVLSIRCMAVGLVFDTVSSMLQFYLQGIRNLKMVNIMNFGERFFIPVITALVLGLLYGSTGVLISVAVGKALLVLMMLIIIWTRNRHFPREIRDLMFLADDFGGDENDSLYRRVSTIDDVMEAARTVADFCSGHGFSQAFANRFSLYVEEMGTNIVRHGKPKSRYGSLAEITVQTTGNQFTLTLRDYCHAFDPVTYYQEHQDNIDSYGIPIVMNSAKNVSYLNAFDSNNTIILDSETCDPRITA